MKTTYMDPYQYIATDARGRYTNQANEASLYGGGISDPYAGMNDQQIAQQALGGRSISDWAAANAAAGGTYDPTTNRFAINSHDDEFDPGYGIMAALAGGMGGLVASGAGLGAGLGEAVSGSYGATAGELGNAAASYGGATGTGAGTMDYGFGDWDLGTGGATGGGTDLSTLGPPTNLQDVFTQAGNVPSGAGSALQRILSGNGGTSDWASLLGTAGSTALGVYGSQQQGNALRDIAAQARTDRQPFLDKANSLLTGGPAAYAAGEGKGALDAVLRGLSVQGNPLGSGTALGLAGDATLRNYQNALTGYANIGLAGQDSRNQLLASAAGADRGVTASIASGLGTLTQPDNSLEALLTRLRGNGLNFGTGLV